MIPLGILGAATPRAVSPWSPAAVFAVPGTGGFWYDPYDLTTLFQDTAGAVPVEEDGDPVALILDKSGNGVHAYQPNSSQRLIWRTSGGRCWLEGNGINQWMYIGATAAETNFAKLYLAARARAAGWNATLVGKIHSDPNFNPWLRWGIHVLRVTSPSTFNTVQTRINGTEYRFAADTWPMDTDVTPIVDHPGGEMRIGANAMSISSADLTYPNSTRATLMQAGSANYFNGRCYGLVGVGRALVGTEASDLRGWMTSK